MLSLSANAAPIESEVKFIPANSSLTARGQYGHQNVSGEYRAVARTAHFFFAFGLSSIAGILTVALSHVLLAKHDLLVPPPYVATWCIDQKLDLLARSDLGDIQLAAIGSSGAWRNLDMTVFVDELGLRSLNAAPCLLFADQTAYLAEFLLPRMPELEVLVFAVLPRDFENCEPENEEFFDRRLLGLVADRRLPRWLPYISGFRPIYMAYYARARARGTGDVGVSVFEDGLGSATMNQHFDWWPDLSISDACFPELTRLEALTEAHGVQLVLALAPIEPVWRGQKDPDGSILADWQTKLRASVSNDVTIIEGDALEFESGRFADPYHLMHPNQTEFSRFIARNMTVRPSLQPPDSDE